MLETYVPKRDESVLGKQFLNLDDYPQNGLLLQKVFSTYMDYHPQNYPQNMDYYLKKGGDLVPSPQVTQWIITLGCRASFSSLPSNLDIIA